MKYIKLNLLFFLLLPVLSLTAQSATDVIGKWHSEDNGSNTKCYFFEHKGNIYGLVYYYQGEGEEFSLEKSRRGVPSAFGARHSLRASDPIPSLCVSLSLECIPS